MNQNLVDIKKEMIVVTLIELYSIIRIYCFDTNAKFNSLSWKFVLFNDLYQKEKNYQGKMEWVSHLLLCEFPL